LTCDARQLTEVLADLLGLSYIEPHIADIEAQLLRKIAPAWCRQYSFIPLSVLDGKVLVAFGDPLDMTHRAAAQQMLACEIEPAIACKSLIRTTLEAIERGGRQNTGVVDENAAVALVDTIIRDAAQLGASDIHIEPMRTHTRVRYRVDGVMMQHLEISSELMPSVTSRIKILAKADIAEKRRHQDGRIQFEDPDSGNSLYRPVLDQRQDQSHVRGDAAPHCPAGSRRHCSGRSPRQIVRGRSDTGSIDRAQGADYVPHRGQHRLSVAPAQHGHRGLSHLLDLGVGGCAAPGTQIVRALRRAVCA
jgi:hypothetical protein